jgi:hypothetical protein
MGGFTRTMVDEPLLVEYIRLMGEELGGIIRYMIGITSIQTIGMLELQHHASDTFPIAFLSFTPKLPGSKFLRLLKLQRRGRTLRSAALLSLSLLLFRLRFLLLRLLLYWGILEYFVCVFLGQVATEHFCEIVACSGDTLHLLETIPYIRNFPSWITVAGGKKIILKIEDNNKNQIELGGCHD